MIRINKQYLNRFKLWGYEYMYQLSKGIYLAFDKDTLDYIGIELFYLPFTNHYEKEADSLLNNLLSKGILEYY